MQQIIANFDIKVVNYTNNVQIDSNTAPLTTKLIINSLENYNTSSAVINLEPNKPFTLANVKYLYLKVMDNNSVLINGGLVTSEFLFNSLTNELTENFILTCPGTIIIRLQYYRLSL